MNALGERKNGMNEFAARIERDFPLRRKEKEKMEFRTWLVHTLDRKSTRLNSSHVR